MLSRRPVVRLTAPAPDPAAGARVAAGWRGAVGALARGLAAAGVDPALVAAAENDGTLAPGALPSGTALSQLLARLAASLMQAAQAPGRDFGSLPAPDGGIACFWNDWMEGLGLTAGRQAAGLVELAFARPQALPAACLQAVKNVFDARVDPFFAPMLRAAEARGLPWRATRRGSSVLAYGQGARQQWFHGTMSNRQSRVCVHLTQRKHLSIELLRAAGLPVPEHLVVTSAAEARAAATRLGIPLVVKPDAGSRAKNIFLDLTDETAVLAAFAHCQKIGPRVLVEKQYDGLPYRVTVCGGKAVIAARHAVPYVVGDGTSSVAVLIERCNAARARPVEDHYSLPLPLKTADYADEMAVALARQKLTLDSVPPAGQEVFLTSVPSLLKGGLHVNITELVHPSTLELAEEAARVLRTESLGVDFIATDITRPHEEVPLVINEVNSAASPRTHVVVPGPPIDLAPLIFAPFFAPGDAGRIPIAAAIGSGVAGFLQDAAALLTAAGETVGIADSTTATVDGFQLRPVEGAVAHPGCALLRDKRTTVALVRVELADIVERGLPSDRLDAVAVTADLLAGADAETRRALETLAGLPGDALVLPAGVEAAWLTAAAPHRRPILVAEPGTPLPAASAAAAAVAAEPAAEVAGAGTMLIALQGARRDPLGRLARPPRDCRDATWAAALLLGLGQDPVAIARLSQQAPAAAAGPQDRVAS